MGHEKRHFPSILHWLIGIVIMMLGMVLPASAPLTEMGVKILMIFVGMIYLWCTVSPIGGSLLGIDWIPIFEDKQVDYDIDIPEQPVRVKLDMDSYMRIINNLIQNVIAHSHADKIKIALSKQGNHMELLLADNGVGIEKEDLKHIFERLYKCDKGRSEKGSGLGLSIVHQLVEKMGGNITVESVPGKGTKFMLLFPLEI